MRLQEQAVHTLNIEYPGRTMETALLEAKERSFLALTRIQELEAEIQRTEFLLAEIRQEYGDAIRAESLFENVLLELCPECERPFNKTEKIAGYKYCTDCGGDPDSHKYLSPNGDE